ncbi:putative acyltransferase [Escherichia coli]|uniref:Putative acyltransferase n=1 Tax=Escherichia coli TaxID=562 RepID=A0A376L6S6_ECOLX|nr:putative acyltransferase [Escherichia coli]STF39772.1 putative acyltransferase [Escherichia coli]
MKQKELWINQIKGLCICLVVIYHSVITFYPHLTTFQHPLSEVLSKCWIYFNLYLAPFRMPVFFLYFRLFDSPLYRQRTVGKLSR